MKEISKTDYSILMSVIFMMIVRDDAPIGMAIATKAKYTAFARLIRGRMTNL